MEHIKLFEYIETQVAQMGGGVKKGVITKKELEAAQEIRVSIRPTNHIGSTELFTLRKLEPEEYHLMLVAVPRKKK
ncbi:MAG: hypothetical protein A2Y79_12025 [Deltaproteobacteria bacterium RBG_13_43_22]|nr:MAG: hypothetical protein A2Y79_12025 [Deltaproteobacteria bacterium RBG_13_43_22]